MKALTYLGPGRRALEANPKPRIEAATDAIVRDHGHDDLRNRSSHSQRRRANGYRRGEYWDTKVSESSKK